MAQAELAPLKPPIRLAPCAAFDMIERAPFLPCAIWSDEHRAYWKPNGNGYTTDRDLAGRWTIARAYRRTSHCGPEKAIHLEPVDYVMLDLSMPPSTNALFVEAAGRKRGEGKQRVKTAPYKAWLRGAALQLNRALVDAGARPDPAAPPFAENFGLWIRLNLSHKGDITNRIKALEDLFVSMGATIGDQWNDRCLVERDRTIGTDCRTIIYREVMD